jgi:hypothetical protein
VQQASLVQTSDGSISHEQFAIPSWLTSAVRASAGVSVAGIEHRGAAGLLPAPSANGDRGDQGTEDGRWKMEDGSSAAADPSSTVHPPSSPSPDAEPSNGNGSGVRKRKPALRFILHESDNEEADRMRLDGLIDLIERYPGSDGVRLFIHARDGDRIELALPDARACEELRSLGIEMLGPNGDADPLAASVRSRGVEALEV